MSSNETNTKVDVKTVLMLITLRNRIISTVIYFLEAFRVRVYYNPLTHHEIKKN